MKHLRMEYGRDAADMALRRVNKRGVDGKTKSYVFQDSPET